MLHENTVQEGLSFFTLKKLAKSGLMVSQSLTQLQGVTLIQSFLFKQQKLISVSSSRRLSGSARINRSRTGRARRRGALALCLTYLLHKVFKSRKCSIVECLVSPHVGYTAEWFGAYSTRALLLHHLDVRAFVATHRRFLACSPAVA